jgi:hypothetical protein
MWNELLAKLPPAGHEISRASSLENRLSVRLFLTAIPNTFRWPISTTSFLPRVMPV